MNNSGNVLSLYEDRPLNWDAWDIDFYYKDSAENMIQRIKDLGKSGHAFATNQELEAFLKSYHFSGPSLVVFFSNGSFDGVIGRFAEFVKKS